MCINNFISILFGVISGIFSSPILWSTIIASFARLLQKNILDQRLELKRIYQEIKIETKYYSNEMYNYREIQRIIKSYEMSNDDLHKKDLKIQFDNINQKTTEMQKVFRRLALSMIEIPISEKFIGLIRQGDKYGDKKRQELKSNLIALSNIVVRGNERSDDKITRICNFIDKL